MSAARPTVALVAHGIHDHGGMERAFFELVRRLHDEIRFVVVSAELDDELRPLVEWRRVRVPMRPIPLKSLLFSLVAGLRLARERVDLVHTLGAIVPNRADVATVQFCCAGFRDATGGLAPASSPPLRRLNTGLARRFGLLLERWCYRPGRLRRLAPVSHRVAGELERHYPRVDVEVNPNGVDLDRFRPDAETRAAVRGEHGVGDDALVVLFVGGAWDHKGLAIAIDALARARAMTARDLELWVVGPGDEARFARVAEDAGVGGAVRFLGPRADTERFYRAADVYVIASLYEAFSIATHEAAATAVPVVATPVGGVEELLAGDDPAGIAIERDAVSMADALARLASDAELRARLGAAGRRRVAGLDWRRFAGGVRTTYELLLEGPR